MTGVQTCALPICFPVTIRCLNCIKETNEVVEEIITKCEEDFHEIKKTIEELKNDEKSSVLPNEQPLGSIRQGAAGISDALQADAEALYWAVLAFPVNMKYKLKIKNKIKIARLCDFTYEQQTILFKRKIKEWQNIASSGEIIVVPENNKRDPVYHYNIIFRAFTSQKTHDMRITFVDAYGIPYIHKMNFCYIKKLEEDTPDKFLNGYLRKQTGKEYQYTGIKWTIPIVPNINI